MWPLLLILLLGIVLVLLVLLQRQLRQVSEDLEALRTALDVPRPVARPEPEIQELSEDEAAEE